MSNHLHAIRASNEYKTTFRQICENREVSWNFIRLLIDCVFSSRKPEIRREMIFALQQDLRLPETQGQG